MPRKPPSSGLKATRGRRSQRRSYDRKRDQQEWRRWYKTARWQRRRQHQLWDEPLCAFCLKEGRTTQATVADHVERHNGDHDKFWHGKLQSLCDEAPWRCHSRVKQRKERLGL